MEFSTRLKLLRKEKGFTQSDVARMVFIDKTAVSKWELGLNFPNQNIQTRLADLFGVSVDYLLGRTDIRNANLSPPEPAPKRGKSSSKAGFGVPKGALLELGLTVKWDFWAISFPRRQ